MKRTVKKHKLKKIKKILILAVFLSMNVYGSVKTIELAKATKFCRDLEKAKKHQYSSYSYFSDAILFIHFNFSKELANEIKANNKPKLEKQREFYKYLKEAHKVCVKALDKGINQIIYKPVLQPKEK